MRAEFAEGCDPRLLEALLDCLAEMGLFEEAGPSPDKAFTDPGSQL